MHLRISLLALALTTILASVTAVYFYDRARTCETRLEPIEAMGRRIEENRRRSADDAAQGASAASALEAEKKRLEAQMKEQQVRVDSLLSQLSSAKDEATRLAIQKQLDEEREKQKRLVGGGASKPGCYCTPGDPLCSCR